MHSSRSTSKIGAPVAKFNRPKPFRKNSAAFSQLTFITRTAGLKGMASTDPPATRPSPLKSSIANFRLRRRHGQRHESAPGRDGAIHDGDHRHWQASADYQERHGIDGRACHGFCGLISVVRIELLPNMRFDFPDGHGGNGVAAVIIEALADDGETTVDIVAWPVGDPRDVHTLLGAATLLGMWNALNPATYVFDHPLIMHRTPLAWLQAGCTGAVVVIPKLAARAFLDLPGRIGAADLVHQRELKSLLNDMINRVEIINPKSVRKAA